MTKRSIQLRASAVRHSRSRSFLETHAIADRAPVALLQRATPRATSCCWQAGFARLQSSCCRTEPGRPSQALQQQVRFAHCQILATGEDISLVLDGVYHCRECCWGRRVHLHRLAGCFFIAWCVSDAAEDGLKQLGEDAALSQPENSPDSPRAAGPLGASVLAGAAVALPILHVAPSPPLPTKVGHWPPCTAPRTVWNLPLGAAVSVLPMLISAAAQPRHIPQQAVSVHRTSLQRHTCFVQGAVVVQHSQLGEFVEALGAQRRFGFCCVPLPPTSPTPPVLPESLRLPQPDAGGSAILPFPDTWASSMLHVL